MTQEPEFEASWWFQPIWKILVKMGNLPQIGVNIKNIWNHHLGRHFTAPPSFGWSLNYKIPPLKGLSSTRPKPAQVITCDPSDIHPKCSVHVAMVVLTQSLLCLLAWCSARYFPYWSSICCNAFAILFGWKSLVGFFSEASQLAGNRQYLENQLLLISINFTPKTSHSCLKKWYSRFSR